MTSSDIMHFFDNFNIKRFNFYSNFNNMEPKINLQIFKHVLYNLYYLVISTDNAYKYNEATEPYGEYLFLKRSNCAFVSSL